MESRECVIESDCFGVSDAESGRLGADGMRRYAVTEALLVCAMQVADEA
jgi:hypothetical protein